MEVKPFLVVPKLIPQPTWGGNYIAEFKGLDTGVFGKTLIGQSYELATESLLSTVPRSNLLPIEIGQASDGSSLEVVGDRNLCFPLQELIEQDPQGVLGERVAEKHGNRMQILIKFTQAKGNSFQVHVRPSVKIGNWKPKPESWYFFEKGKVTLGLKSPFQLEEYKKVCHDIKDRAEKIGLKIQNQEVAAEQGRKELADFIWSNSPYDFVNELTLDPESTVDLAGGGVHHSWEEGEEIPHGNIVYEVQLNVMDKDCTLRSFDKGKIADDGSLRPIHIDDYFLALDTDTAHNDPATHLRKPVMFNSGGIDIAPLFDSVHYKSSLLAFSGEYSGTESITDPKESFHHLFVKEGEIELETKFGIINAGKGASLFVPASVGKYKLRTSSKAMIIKTWS